MRPYYNIGFLVLVLKYFLKNRRPSRSSTLVDLQMSELPRVESSAGKGITRQAGGDIALYLSAHNHARAMDIDVEREHSCHRLRAELE